MQTFFATRFVEQYLSRCLQYKSNKTAVKNRRNNSERGRGADVFIALLIRFMQVECTLCASGMRARKYADIGPGAHSNR